MPDAELVVVHMFATRPEADLAKSSLEAADIDAMIQADTTGDMRPHLGWASGGFRLIVREEDVDAARDVLDLPAQPV